LGSACSSACRSAAERVHRHGQSRVLRSRGCGIAPGADISRPQRLAWLGERHHQRADGGAVLPRRRTTWQAAALQAACRPIESAGTGMVHDCRHQPDDSTGFDNIGRRTERGCLPGLSTGSSNVGLTSGQKSAPTGISERRGTSRSASARSRPACFHDSDLGSSDALAIVKSTEVMIARAGRATSRRKQRRS
jgi:hypothetical protein